MVKKKDFVHGDLYKRDFWVYTWYINVKLGSMHNWEHFVLMFNSKFFYALASFILFCSI